LGGGALFERVSASKMFLCTPLKVDVNPPYQSLKSILTYLTISHLTIITNHTIIKL